MTYTRGSKACAFAACGRVGRTRAFLLETGRRWQTDASRGRAKENLSLMLQEIAEQPAALRATIDAEREKVARLGRHLRQREIDLIVLVARGSSDNAALFGRYLIEIATGIPVSLAAPSVHTLYEAKLNLSHALVVGVSQSGEGEDINRVLETARGCGAYTVGITNEAESAMTRLVDETLLMHGGRERSVAATK